MISVLLSVFSLGLILSLIWDHKKIQKSEQKLQKSKLGNTIQWKVFDKNQFPLQFNFLFYSLPSNSVQINDFENISGSQGNCLAFYVQCFQIRMYKFFRIVILQHRNKVYYTEFFNSIFGCYNIFHFAHMCMYRVTIDFSF